MEFFSFLKPKQLWMWILIVVVLVVGIIVGKRIESMSSYGTLYLSSNPSGATIWIDGKSTNKKTPAVIRNIMPGNHSLQYSLPGYKESQEVITVDFKEKVIYSINLISSGYGTINGHDYVDLGLSVKWATCNIGASTPQECGDYFAWGEIKPHRMNDYNLENYEFYVSGNFENPVFSKYNTIDGKTSLDFSDDAARANWGGAWRMPNKMELRELEEMCIWEWTTMLGHEGYKVTSKTNGNSIFLPASGYIDDDTFCEIEWSGFGWSSSLDSEDLRYAYRLDIISSSLDTHDPHYSDFVSNPKNYNEQSVLSRETGLPIRPVTE